MNALPRRRALGVLASSSLAVVGGLGSLFPEGRLLRADAASAALAIPNGRRLQGRVMAPGALGRAITDMRASSRGASTWAIARSEGFAPRIQAAFGVDAVWDDGTSAGTTVVIPATLGGRRALLVRRATPTDELAGIAIERGDGWVEVRASTPTGTELEASFRSRGDGTVLVRGADGTERVVTPPSASVGSGRKGLASPNADGVIQQICSTVCNWWLDIVCMTFLTLTAFFVCAWVAVDSLGTLALSCALVFMVVSYLTCSTVPQWACSQVCTW